MAESPTQRTLKHLRNQGCLAGVVEYWQPSNASREVVSRAEQFVAGGDKQPLVSAVGLLQKFGPGKRQDLFDFVDIVGIGDRVRFIQCTTTSGLASRITKIQTECTEALHACLNANVSVEAWGWKRYAKPVNRKHWRPTIKYLRLASNGGVSVEQDPATMSKHEREVSQAKLPF